MPSDPLTGPESESTLQPPGATSPARDISVEPTVAPAASEAPSSPVTVRAGRRDDYRELQPVDALHYVVGNEIAKGGMGRILTARDRRLGRSVAIKELLADTAELRTRFEREARITANLQHPAIVNIIEAGVWPNGQPFYVMKLVTGDSLDAVVAARETLAERLALLPNMIAVVDALAYAHDKGVIHRDLKPANVLVGEFGETVVIDWGLAKELADTSPDHGVGVVIGSGDETVAGSVMGTPAYMAPEQARGEAVDARADVYALGAMLYRLLAGASPYSGTSVEALLAAVMKGERRPLAERAPGIPPDLVTIVDKAMATDPADRYPSAKELADDLKKFQTGQLVGSHRYSTWQLVRRWIGRHRTAVTVAFVAVALLATLAVISVRRIVREQARTEEQRQVAERSRDEADDLLSFMLVDLRDKLQPVGKLDLLDAVAQKAGQYYARRPDTRDAEEQSKRSLALTNLGDVLALRNDLAGALTSYRAALAILQPLAANDPENSVRQRDLATALHKVGTVLVEQGDPKGLEHHEASLAIRERMARLAPHDSERQRELASSHERIGDILQTRGNLPEALSRFRLTLEIRQKLDAKNLTWRRDLIPSHTFIASVLRNQGQGQAALEHYRAATKVAQELVAAEPANAKWQADLVLCRNNLGNQLVAEGNVPDGLIEYRAALAVVEALVARDPTNAEWQGRMWNSRIQIGDALEDQGDLKAALVEHELGLAIATRLANQDASNDEWQRNLSASYERIGSVLRRQGDLPGALANFQKDLAIAKKLTTKDPNNVRDQRGLSLSHEKIAFVLRAQGDLAGALASFQASFAVVSGLAKRDPTSTLAQSDLSMVHAHIGDVHASRGEHAKALDAYRSSLELRKQLAAKEPANPEVQRLLGMAHSKLGNALLGTGDAEGAVVQYRASEAITAQILAKNPTSLSAMRTAMVTQNNIGNALSTKGDREGALRALRAALTLATQLSEAAPENADWHGDRATAHENIGELLLEMRDPKGALVELRAALAIRKELVAKSPGNPGWRADLAALEKRLATCCR